MHDASVFDVPKALVKAIFYPKRVYKEFTSPGISTKHFVFLDVVVVAVLE